MKWHYLNSQVLDSILACAGSAGRSRRGEPLLGSVVTAGKQEGSHRKERGACGQSRAERLPLALAGSFLIILWVAPPSGHAPKLENQNTK